MTQQPEASSDLSDDGAGRNPPLALSCFGAPAIVVNGEAPPPDILWRKNVAMLVYLALSPSKSRSREHLLGILWPDKTAEKARHSLNEAIRRIRSGLGRERILSRGDQIELSAKDLTVDVLDGGGELTGRGEFLEGFYLDDAPEFDEWTDRQRDRLRMRDVGALVRRGEDLLTTSPGDAREVAAEILQRDPLSEPGINLYMRAAALAGDASSALVAFNRFGARLKERIGEAPGREISALAERVRRENWRKAYGRGAEAEPPLVGRKEEYRQAFAAVNEGLNSGPACLVVTGEPGMGRSRLVSACLERVALEGGIVAAVRPLESDGGAPWSMLRSLVRAGLADAPGLAGTDPGSLGVLASVVPMLAERFEPAEPQDNNHVASAFTSLVEALSEDTPVALAVDDAHFSDGASLAALLSMMSQLDAAPVIVILSVGTARDDAPYDLMRFQGEVGRGIAGAVVRLEPLTVDDIAQLVLGWEPGVLDGVDPQRLARRIAYEAGGSPFFAVELLRGLEKVASLRDDVAVWPVPNQTLESPLPFQMPALVRRAIAARIVDLDDVSRKVLCAASIGGEVLDLDLVAHLSGLDEGAVDGAIAVLERRHFVEFDGQRYVFAAPVIGEVVMQECLTRGEKQRMRKHAIQILNDKEDLDSLVLSTELLSAASAGEEAFHHALNVAEAALEQGRLRTAKRAVVAAQRSVGAGYEDGRAKVAALKIRLETAT